MKDLWGGGAKGDAETGVCMGYAWMSSACILECSCTRAPVYLDIEYSDVGVGRYVYMGYACVVDVGCFLVFICLATRRLAWPLPGPISLPVSPGSICMPTLLVPWRHGDGGQREHNGTIMQIDNI